MFTIDRYAEGTPTCVCFERWGGGPPAAPDGVGTARRRATNTSMNVISVLIVLAALAGQLSANGPSSPPADGAPPVLQPDGSYLQAIQHVGLQPEGWASLRLAFHSRSLVLACPGSQARR